MDTKHEKEMAEMALDQLLLAYAKGEVNGGSVEWEDIDIAVDYAQAALPGRYEEIIKQLIPATYLQYQAECHENGEIPCSDTTHHVWVANDEEHFYCEKCGTREY